MGQPWRDLHAEQASLIRQTFRKLGLSLAVDGSEDEELSIKDIPNIQVGHWRQPVGMEDIQEVDESELNVDGVQREVRTEEVVYDEMEYIMEGDLKDEMDNLDILFENDGTESKKDDETDADED